MAKERIFPFRSNEMIPTSPYRIRKVMGSGGMAAVYEADDVSLQKRVVVKVLHPELADTPAAELMRKEARGLAAMYRHSNAFTCVLRTDDVDVRVELGGRQKQVRLPYYVMEPIDGPTLRAILNYQANRGEPLAISKALGVARDVATALAHAHGEGIVHRDIKPENIMFHYKKNEPVAVRVIDFGVIGRMGVDANTTDHTFKGTLLYAAPEQLAERQVTGATDLYALGVVMFEMFTGRTPFAGPPHDVAHGHLYVTPPRVSDLRPEVAPQLVDIVASLLMKDPFARVAMFRRRALRDAQHGLVLAQALEDIRRSLQGSPADAGAIDDVVSDVRRRARDTTTNAAGSSRERVRRRVEADDGAADGHVSTVPPAMDAAGVDDLLGGLKRVDPSEVVVGKRRPRGASAPRPDAPPPRMQDKTDVDAHFVHALAPDQPISLAKTQPLPSAATLARPPAPLPPALPEEAPPITPSPVFMVGSTQALAPPEAPRLDKTVPLSASPAAAYFVDPDATRVAPSGYDRVLNSTADIMGAAFEDDAWHDSDFDEADGERTVVSSGPLPVVDDVDSESPVAASGSYRAPAAPKTSGTKGS